MQKYPHMQQAYELHQVKQGISYFFRNKESSPIIPYFSASIKLRVAFTKFDIDQTCRGKLDYLF